LRAEKERLR